MEHSVDIEARISSGQLTMERSCFIPHETEVFIPCHIVLDDGGTEVTVEELQGVNSGKQHEVKRSDCVMMDRDEMASLIASPPSDLIHLSDVNEPSLLYILKKNFSEDKIYTSAGSVLVAVNPFKSIPGMYADSRIQSYKNGIHNLSNTPHIFAIAHNAFQGITNGDDQSLIVSGESGAGKTEATKHCMTYLTAVAGSKTGAHEKILQASPILEAWGNAKTLRNNNSSRFGKYTEMWMDSLDNSIVGASIETYLLEKTRVVSQEKNERNYHAFYQLLKGAPAEVLSAFKLDSFAHDPDKLHYIGQSGCVAVDGIDDKADYEEVVQAFEVLGFSQEERMNLEQVLAAVLLLGNLAYEEDDHDGDKCHMTEDGEDLLDHVAELIGVGTSPLRTAMLNKKVQRGGNKRASVAYRPYSVSEAVSVRDAFAKELYKRSFHAIVTKINSLVDVHTAGGVSVTDKLRVIGMLDIFGFEIFESNSFEQLCINLCNEVMQSQFNRNIFEKEIATYKEEGIPLPVFEYKDNGPVIELLTKKQTGVRIFLGPS